LLDTGRQQGIAPPLAPDVLLRKSSGIDGDARSNPDGSRRLNPDGYRPHQSDMERAQLRDEALNR
jgi:hypothetical protein